MFMLTLNILLCSLLEGRTLTKFTFTGANVYRTFSRKLVSYSLSGAAMEKIRMQIIRQTLILYICFVYMQMVLLLFSEHRIHYKDKFSCFLKNIGHCGLT